MNKIMVCVYDMIYPVVLVSSFLLITVPLSANAASTEGVKVARSKCTSVEQEIIDFETLEKQIAK